MSDSKAKTPNPLDAVQEHDNRGVETQAVRPVAGVHETPPVQTEYQPGEKKLPDGTIRNDY